MTHYLRDEKGSTLVESAVALPLILFMILGYILFGLYSNAQTAVSSAARAAAREYGVYGHEAGALERARSQAEAILTAGGLSGDYEIIIEDHTAYVEVQILYSQSFPGSGLIALVGGGEAGAEKITNTSVRGYALYRREQSYD